MQKNMKYKTSLLDEASFLILKGFRYSMKRTGVNASQFTFEDTRELQSARKHYFTDNVQVSLHRWISIRNQLKHAQSKMLIELKKVAVGGVTVKSGDKYYYIQNNKIMSALYGDSDIHAERIKEKNFYLDIHDASKFIK